MRHYNDQDTKALFRTLNEEPALHIGAISLAPEQRWKVGTVTDIRFADIDFSAPKLVSRFGGRGRFENCHFTRVALDGISAKRIDFVDCTFRGVTLDRLLSRFSSCRFERCEFYDCHIGGAHFEQTEFVSCKMDTMRGDSATCWERCRFENTRLSGTLHHAAFISGVYINSDFSRAQLLNASFTDSQSGGVALPDTRQLFAVSPDMLMLAVDRLRHRLDHSSLNRYESIARTLSDSNAVELVHRELFSQELGQQGGELVMETLYEMAHRA